MVTRNSEFTEGSWLDNGPHIEGDKGEHLVCSTLLDKTNDYTSVALVKNERDVALILQAPEMYWVLEEIVMLNTFKKHFGETATYRSRMNKAMSEAELIIYDFIDFEK